MPDGIHHHFMRKHLLLVQKKQCQNIKLFFRQVNSHAINAHRTLFKADLQVFNLDHSGFVFALQRTFFGNAQFALRRLCIATNHIRRSNNDRNRLDFLQRFNLFL